jgi:hypothetical protein
MSFVYPDFLWANLLIVIPIIIHLFNFRRYKTVYFSRVKFLKEVIEDSRSGSKLKHLLILFTRILTILCLVTAFAQPFFPVDNSSDTENVTSIYIDNSYSLQAEGKDGNLLNELKNKAIGLVKSFEENEMVNLITADLLSVHQRFYSKSEVIDMIKEIDFSAKSTELYSAINLQSDLLNSVEKKSNKRIFLFSDFQKSSSNLSDWSRKEIPAYYYQCKPEQKGNIFIDSVWFESPVHRVNTQVDIHFRIQNNSSEDQIDLPVLLDVNGNSPGPKRINIPANSFVEDKISFTDRTSGIKSGELSISTSQLFFDDSFYFSYEIKEQVKILLIAGANDKTTNIEQLYGLDSYYNCISLNINEVSSEDFKDKEFIIFQNVNSIPSGLVNLLEESLKNGASVMLIPGNKLDFTNWNNLMSTHQLPTFSNIVTMDASLGYFNSRDPLYSGVFEGDPKDFKHPNVSSSYDLLMLNNQNFVTLFGNNISSPFLYYSTEGNGRMIVLRSPLDIAFTDFQNHALFAATMLRFAETAAFEKPLYSEIGKMVNYPLNVEIEEKYPVHMENKEYGVDIIPQLINTNSSRSISFSHLEGKIKKAGIYSLLNNDGFNEKIAINYNRNESYTEAFTNEEILNNFSSAEWNEIKELTIDEKGMIEINTFQASEYWRILLILALIFIAIEILLLKLWKT